MTEFAGRTAVVTGGGSGMGRELVRQLVAEACNVAMCDVSPTGLAETKAVRGGGIAARLRVTTHIVDVGNRTQVERFRDEVADRHQTDKIHLLFNNAGISGGGHVVTNSRDEWERTFNICWGGVYNCTRAFLPMLQYAKRPHRQHQQHQRLLGVGRATRPAHRLFGREICRQRIQQGADHRYSDQRAAHQVLGRHARPIGTSIRANTRKIHSGDRESDAIDAAGLARRESDLLYWAATSLSCRTISCAASWPT